METVLKEIGNKMEESLEDIMKKEAAPVQTVQEPEQKESLDNPTKNEAQIENKESDQTITVSILEAQNEAHTEAGKLLAKDEGLPLEISAPTLLQAGADQVSQKEADLLTSQPQTSTTRRTQLDFLLQKAETFSGFINECQNEVQDRLSAQIKEEAVENEPEVDENDSPKSRKRKSAGRGRRKGGKAAKKTKTSAEAEDEMADAEKRMAEARSKDRPLFRQPKKMVNGTLKGYQLEGLRWLASLYENGLSGILADEMGLGKTIQVIAFLAYLTEMQVSGPFLIAAPLATLPNWVNEFKKWVPSIPCLLYHGSKSERAELRSTRLRPQDQRKPLFPVVVTSYEICIIDRAFLQNYNWKFMVIDEGQRIKNRNCRLVRELKQLNSESRLLLSGTPIQNTLEELWTLLNFVNPAIFDDLSVFQSWFGFRNIGKETQVSDIVDGEERERIVTKLHEILRPFLLRRLKKDVILKMPPKQEIVIYAPMTQLQIDYCELIQQDGLRDALLQMNIEGSHGLSEMNRTMNLRKACNHPFLFGEPRDGTGEYIGISNPNIMIQASGKLALFDKMLVELHSKGHKTLVFSQMTQMLNILEDQLRFRGLRYCRIDGSVKVMERQQMIDAFNTDPDIACFLLSTRAGGLGINLTAADTCIIYDSDWNPHQDSQAQDRCHRIGQTKPVAVYRLVTANSVEVEMMEKAISKKKLERMAIAGGDFRCAGRRTSKALTTTGLLKLLEDDIGSLKRMAMKAEIEELEISDEEYNLFMNREKIFNGELPEDGEMYSVVEVKDSFLAMA